MSTVEDDFMEVDAEMARIWNEDEDVDFIQLRANEREAEESEEETPEPLEEPSEESDEGEGTVEEEVEESDSVEEDDQPETEEAKVPKIHKYKANGMDFEFTEEEVLEKFGEVFGKSMNYTKKTQELKPWMKQISAIKSNGLNEDDVNLMIDAYKGDKQAIAEMLKRTKVDPLDLDTEATERYIPTQHGKDEATQAIESIIDDISRDPEYRITENVVDSQWDSASRRIMAENPEMIRGLHIDIKNGLYDKVAPMAMKMKVMDGGVNGSDLDYYIAAGKQYGEALKAQESIASNKVKSVQRQETLKSEAPKRKAASVSKSTSGRRDVVDYLSEDDDSYSEWYKTLMSKQ